MLLGQHEPTSHIVCIFSHFNISIPLFAAPGVPQGNIFGPLPLSQNITGDVIKTVYSKW